MVQPNFIHQKALKLAQYSHFYTPLMNLHHAGPGAKDLKLAQYLCFTDAQTFMFNVQISPLYIPDSAYR